jgi:hypothetical protein
MTTFENSPAGAPDAPYRPGEQVFAVYTTPRGTEAGYGWVLACVPGGPAEAGWTLIAEVGDLVLTYPLDRAGHSTAVHRPIRRHAVDRVLPTLLHADAATAGCVTGRAETPAGEVGKPGAGRHPGLAWAERRR